MIFVRLRVANALVLQTAPLQRYDLLSPWRTQTQLIGCLDYLTNKLGYDIEITAIRADHSDDSALGPHCHAHGWCVDCWPLLSKTPGDYMDPSTHKFRQFLVDLQHAPFHEKTGLAGTADTPENLAAAGPTAFEDDGADHVHIQCWETA